MNWPLKEQCGFIREAVRWCEVGELTAGEEEKGVLLGQQSS